MTKRDGQEVFVNPSSGQITPDAMTRRVSPRSGRSGEIRRSPQRVQGEGEYVGSSERGPVSAQGGHISHVPRLNLSPRGAGGSGLYYGEQVPLQGGTIEGHGDLSHRVASPNGHSP